MPGAIESQLLEKSWPGLTFGQSASTFFKVFIPCSFQVLIWERGLEIVDIKCWAYSAPSKCSVKVCVVVVSYFPSPWQGFHKTEVQERRPTICRKKGKAKGCIEAHPPAVLSETKGRQTCALCVRMWEQNTTNVFSFIQSGRNQKSKEASPGHGILLQCPRYNRLLTGILEFIFNTKTTKKDNHFKKVFYYHTYVWYKN